MRDIKQSIKLEITRIFNSPYTLREKKTRAEEYLDRMIKDGYISSNDTGDIKAYILDLAYIYRLYNGSEEGLI